MTSAMRTPPGDLLLIFEGAETVCEHSCLCFLRVLPAKKCERSALKKKEKKTLKIQRPSSAAPATDVSHSPNATTYVVFESGQCLFVIRQRQPLEGSRQ